MKKIMDLKVGELIELGDGAVYKVLDKEMVKQEIKKPRFILDDSR